MNRTKAFAVIVATLCLVSSPAAGQVQFLYCYGTVNRIFIHENGDLFMLPSYRNDWMKVCNIKADWQGVSPIVCQAWLTTLKDALKGDGTGTGTRMTITVQYVNQPATQCDQLATYTVSPKPAYIMVTAQ